MIRLKILVLMLAFIAAALGYLLFWPVPIDPVAWAPSSAPQLTGIYQPNSLLASIERMEVGPWPEDLAFDRQGRIYTGLEDGRIMRLQPNGSLPELFVDTGGRPLGLAFDRAGNLLVADAYKGLLSVAANGSISVLSVQAGGIPFRLTDGLDDAVDKTIYFSDASSKFDNSEYMADIFEQRPHGRLLAYNPENKTTMVLLDGLYFANGVALSPDQSFVLVVETNAYRVQRYWLRGPLKGRSEIFADNLPGIPDGISSNGNDTFWIAFVSVRDPAMDTICQHPFLLKILMRLPPSFTALKPYGMVIGLDNNGIVTKNLQDASGSYAQITNVREHNGSLYFGSIAESALGR
jgi:sugar lactone lactonase YvrE